MARGMNAVTATNHLMGETTALIVLLDALGAPGENEAQSSPNDESRSISAVISTLTGLASCVELSEESLLEKFRGIIDKDGIPTHGGTVYDATLMLRERFIEMLELKIVANIILQAKYFPPVSAIALTIGLSIHITANLVILEMVKEAYILNFADQQLLSKIAKLRNGLQAIVLPALSSYSNTVVGKSGTEASGASPQASVLSEAVKRTIDHMRTAHGLSELAVYPPQETLQLPVIPERLPPTSAELASFSSSANAGKIAVEKSRSLWTGHDRPKGVGAEVYNRITDIKDSVSDFLDPIDDIIDAAERATSNTLNVGGLGNAVNPFLNEARKWKDKVKNHLKPAHPPTNAEVGGVGYRKNPSIDRLHEIPWEQESRSQWVRSTYPAVDSLRAPFRHLFREHLPLSSASTFLMHWTNRFTLEDSWSIRSGNAASQLPSILPDEAEQLKHLLAELQHKVQLLRQEFENVTNGPGALAANITIGGMAYSDVSSKLTREVAIVKKKIDGLLHKLPFGEELRKWMDRVLNHETELAQLLQPTKGKDPDLDFFETEFDAMASDLARVEILDELLKLLEDLLGQLEDLVNIFDSGPPHMYVMSDSAPDLKGIEPWTSNTILADKKFTVLAVVHRKPKAADFGQKLFGIGSEKGITATAQAMFYNANGRRIPEQRPPKSPTQPDTGWDTLNWKPPVQAPEWGDTAPTNSGGNVLDIFQSSHSPDRPSQIQLNWQAKLTPVTQTRLRAARQKLPWSDLLGREPTTGKNDQSLIQH